MIFRIILFGMIGYIIFKLYRKLVGGSRPSSPFRKTKRRRGYNGQAVDARFEEINDDDKQDDASNDRKDA